MRQKYTKVEALAEVIFARKAVGEIHRSYQSCISRPERCPVTDNTAKNKENPEM